MRVGVVGAGTMGAGIAEVFVRAPGFEVVLADVNEQTAASGRERQLARMQRKVRDGRMRHGDLDDISSRWATGTVSDLSMCHLVIEAIRENIADKRSVFEQLDSQCGKDAMFCSNTSSLSITELGRGLSHSVVGMHFFNPAPVVALVEIVAGAATPSELIDRAIETVKAIGKVPVQVEESPGFVVNRVLIPMINEAVGLLADGVASAEGIDEAMKLGANHPLGPLALGDLIGLDVVLAVMEVLLAETGDPKYRPHYLLRKKVRAGQLGRKAKRGFFVYN